MACNCIDDIAKLMREKLDDPNARMRGVVAFDGGKAVFRPTIAILYRKKKKNGERAQQQSEMELAYGYCPFCGEKL